MGREEAAYEDNDDFDVAVNDDDYELELLGKDSLTNRDGSPIAKRRMIEALLEERQLKKQLDDDFDFDED
ncbi:PA3496 family putative envelope integrity protein [Marinospirillum perlucidum]|uniref:PA3496 family putative envelope integrity protein n=1 Tax=Marinospirillum perlucidum TaxID=1982602 RepID=UPI000DF2AEF4|nr:hypothetical protein [Marinospirillum perlucidum]